MPTTVIKTVGTAGDYTTWALWEDATDNTSLVATDEIRVGNQVNESLSTPAITMTGATTDATRYREMRGQGFDGIGGGAVLNMGAGVLTITESNFRCTTLNIEFAGTGTSGINIFTGTNILVDRCVIYDTNLGTGRTYMILLDNPGGATIRRCVIVGWNRSVAAVAAGITWKVQNCTLIGRSNTTASGIPFQGAVNITATGTLENCIVSAFHNRDISLGWTTIRNNISRDSTSTGTGALTGKIEGDIRFRNLALYDYSVRSGSVVAGAGADLSADFTTDITGRAITTPFPIGAHLPVAAPTFAGIATAVNNADGSVKVSWLAGTAQGAAIDGYKVHVHTAAPTLAELNADTYLVAAVPVGRTQLDVFTLADGVTPLTANTLYYFAARAINVDQDEDANVVSLSATVTSGVPGSDITGTSVSTSTTSVLNTLATFPATIADRWKILYRLATSNTWIAGGTNTTLAAGQTISISGLSAGATYEFAFVAATVGKDGNPGDINTVTLPVGDATSTPRLLVRSYRDLAATAHTLTNHIVADGFIRSAVDARARWVQYDYEEPNANQPLNILAHELQLEPKKRN